MQTIIAIGGMLLLIAAAWLSLSGIAWVSLLAARHLPLVGRRGRTRR